MYTVAVPDHIAQENMKKAQVEKLAKRWDHESDDTDDEDDHHKSSSGSTAVGLELNTVTGHRGPSPFTFRPDTRDGTRTLGRASTESSRREDQVEEVRGLLRRESTQGRRRKPVPDNQLR
ncbi:hypothetical protein K440DRAFT_107781 [Wilcoxina mikolae CBS 423.85]|nr:hypothetical protein K440DRAFT_107781 [Wilcoxina mikolae CBS 423.85]